MRRQRALLIFALGALARRRGRNASIAVGIAFLVGLVCSVLFMADSLRREFALGISAAPDLTLQRMVAGRPATIPVDTGSAMRDAPGVRALYPRVWGYLFVEALGANVTVVGRHQGASFPSELVAGDTALGGTEPPRALVGESLAHALGTRPGDRMVLPRYDGEMVLIEAAGIFTSSSAIYTADVLVVEPATARALLGMPEGDATDIAVELTTPDEATVVGHRLAQLVDGSRVLDRRALKRTYELTFDGRAGLLSVLLLPALAALLLLGWDRLSGVGQDERREIGILKAIGWSTSDVLAARIWESLLVSMAASLVGLVLGYVFVFVLGAPGLSGALLGWSTLYPKLDLVPVVDLTQAFSIGAMVVVPFVALSVVPAWRAATVDPDRAMRGEP